jgi:hypothetical protein
MLERVCQCGGKVYVKCIFIIRQKNESILSSINPWDKIQFTMGIENNSKKEKECNLKAALHMYVIDCPSSIWTRFPSGAGIR